MGRIGLTASIYPDRETRHKKLQLLPFSSPVPRSPNHTTTHGLARALRRTVATHKRHLAGLKGALTIGEVLSQRGVDIQLLLALAANLCAELKQTRRNCASASPIPRAFLCEHAGEQPRGDVRETRRGLKRCKRCLLYWKWSCLSASAAVSRTNSDAELHMKGCCTTVV